MPRPFATKGSWRSLLVTFLLVMKLHIAKTPFRNPLKFFFITDKTRVYFETKMNYF